MTPEEKKIFNRIVNSGQILVMDGNQMVGGVGSMPMLGL